MELPLHKIITFYNHCKKYIHPLSKSLGPKLPLSSPFKNCNFPYGHNMSTSLLADQGQQIS